MRTELYQRNFVEYLPLIRRTDVKRFGRHKPLWLARTLGIEEVRKVAETMEYESQHFYRKAAETARDGAVRKLLLELADTESQHEALAHKLEAGLTTTERARED